MSPKHKNIDGAGDVLKRLRSGIFGGVIDFDLDKIEADVRLRASENHRLQFEVDEILWEIKEVRICLSKEDAASAIHSALYVGLLYGALISRLANNRGGRKGEPAVWSFIEAEYLKDTSVKKCSIVSAGLAAYTAATGNKPKGKPETYERNFRKHFPF